MQITLLDKNKYKDFTLEFKYTSKYYYDIEVEAEEIFSIKLVKKTFDKEKTKSFTGNLYDEWLENPYAFMLTDNGKPLGYLEVDIESWNNRLRISELLILEEYRYLGYGSILIDKAKEIAKEKNAREIILETQSCNSKAIDFYIKNGFSVNGIDLSCYSNDDISKKEVRLEMVFRL